MTRKEMVECMETAGSVYTYELVAKQIGFEEDRVKEALHCQTPPWDFNVLISLNRYFDAAESQSNMVSESMAYRIEKQQGNYTIEDYDELPEDWRVELIDGVIYKYNAPTTTHQFIVFQIAHQIESHIEEHGGNCVPFISPVCVQLDCDEQTMVQPDVMILCEKEKNINRGIYGAPDFVAEVLSPSTRHNDLGIKLKKYANAGVREYWIIDSKREQVIVHLFQKDSEGKVVDSVSIYGFTDQISMHIYGGTLKIDFAKILRKMERVFPKGDSENDIR